MTNLTEKHTKVHFTADEIDLFGSGSPLVYQNILDPRPGHRVHLVRYSPTVDGQTPPGYGLGNTLLDGLFGTRTVMPFWLQEPGLMTDLVIKMKDPEDPTSELEKLALEKINPLFHSMPKSRPINIFGYGVAGDYKEGTPYLILEKVPDRFQTLKQILHSGSYPDPVTGVNLCTDLAEILTICHTNGVIHCDLDGEEAMGHIYWDQSTGDVRIIDWGNARVVGNQPRDELVGAYHTDQNAVGKILYGMIAGESFGLESYQNRLVEKYGAELGDKLYRVIGKCVGVDKAVPGYEDGHNGTALMHQDLSRILNDLRGR